MPKKKKTKKIKKIKKLEKQKTNTVKGHSKKDKGNFFDVILKPVRAIFEDDSE